MDSWDSEKHVLGSLTASVSGCFSFISPTFRAISTASLESGQVLVYFKHGIKLDDPPFPGKKNHVGPLSPGKLQSNQ